MVNELQLESFSIRKTEHIDDAPWYYILKQLKLYLTETPIKITICKGLIETTDSMHREFLIRENHSSAIGGHKGVNKI